MHTDNNYSSPAKKALRNDYNRTGDTRVDVNVIEPTDEDVSWQNELFECPFGTMRIHDLITVQGFLLYIYIVWRANQRSSK